MNVKKILCPVDFSSRSDAALAYASSLASEAGAFLHIVYVDEGSPTYVPGYSEYGYIPEPPIDWEREQRERLARVRPTTDVPYDTRFLFGNPGKEILRFAQREQVDLIVLGSHGRTGLSRLLMGSVAEAVMRRAQCPVLTVKQPLGDHDEPVAANGERAANDNDP